MNRKLSLLLISFAVLLAACAPATQSAPQAETQELQQFVGAVEGSNAFIGIATQGNRILAYVCDGILEQAPTIYSWFKGELAGNSFDLTSDDGFHLIGQVESNKASGTVQFSDGSQHTFAADLAQPPAGLFRLEQDQVVSGWIVMGTVFRGGKRMSGDGSLIKIDPALITMDDENLAVP